jgi:hypothetical protein
MADEPTSHRARDARRGHQPRRFGCGTEATTTGTQSPAVVAGGSVTITYNSMSSEEKEAFAKQVAEKLLVAMKEKGTPQIGPGAEQHVEQAVTGIAKGASEGDQQLQQALSLLAAGNAAQATPLLKAVLRPRPHGFKRTGKKRRLPIATSAPLPACAIPREPGMPMPRPPSLIPTTWRACIGPDGWRWIMANSAAPKRD